MRDWVGLLPRPSVRTIEDMGSVLADPACRKRGPLYYMYRDLAKSDEDRDWLHQRNLRYDITVIPPSTICGERVKTKGHFHPKNPAGVGYPEVYEVFEGCGHYLLQNRHCDDVVMVSANPGDLIIIPPEYGHVTINPSPNSTLAMANIVSSAFESEYGVYEQYHGGAYYEMSDGSLRKNSRYPGVSHLRNIPANCMAERFPPCRGSLYSLIGNNDSLLFLNFPEKYFSYFSLLLADVM